MTHKKTKAKLIWAVTSSGLDKLGVSAITKTILHHHLDAVRMTYSQEAKKKFSLLREKLNSEFSGQENQPAEGHVPFLFNFVGRRAILSIPGNELEATDGQLLQIQVSVDCKFCASSVITPSTSKFLEIRVSHEDQIKNLVVNSKLSFSYGAAEAKVTEITVNSKNNSVLLTCQVELGGLLLSGMDVTSPHMSTDLFPLLPEDEKTLADKDFSAIADYAIVGGINTAEELFLIKKAILQEDAKLSKRHPSVSITNKILEKEAILAPRFLLKIDSARSLELLPSLLQFVDGVYLSRAELGQTNHPHNLPILQKELVAQCNKMSKTIIVASELMHSMCKNSNPTRAEVSDMANAAADGADALAFSHAVTEGPHANLVAQVSRETLIDSEAWYEKKWRPFEMSHIPSDDDAVTYGAIRIAEQAKVRAIVCFTEGGYTAMKLSSLGTPTQIIAITCNNKIMRQMNLLRSVTCALLDTKLQMEKILQETKTILINNFNYKKGEKFVFVSLTASSVAARNSNLFTLQEID
ncbi:MAG: pyruvate kinase [Bdellovibrionota bacterium]